MKNIKRYTLYILKNNKATSCIAFIIMLLISISDLYIPQLTINILDNAIELAKPTLLIRLIFIYGIVIVFSSCMNILLEYIYSKLKKKISISLKLNLLKHISKLSGNYFTKMKTGDTLRIVENDMYTIENFSIDIIFSLIMNVFTAVIAIYFLIQMQIDLFVIIVIIQVLVIFLESRFTKIIASKTKDVRHQAGSISNLLQEYISNIVNVIVSKSVFHFFSKLISGERKLIHKMIGLDVTISSSIAIGSLLNGLCDICIYGYGGYKIIKSEMSFGELIAFQQYTTLLMGPCMSIIKSNTKIQQTEVSINRVYRVLDEPIEIMQKNMGHCSTSERSPEIKFTNANFSYNNHNSIIENLNMVFTSGKITAVVGSSGCGKTTISKLLYRLWDVDSGNITLDAIPIQEYNLKWLRKNIAFITQDIFLFDDTLLNNMTLGNKNIKKEWVEEICKYVDVDTFIRSLPDRYDTVVGEKGVKLSGGQKQRISIVRELLSDAQIIIFDEATSSLDNISQSKILQNISHLLKNKTTIVIAHRLSTIKDADIIYVMGEKHVIEKGTHEELVLQGGYYYSLLKEQE